MGMVDSQSRSSSNQASMDGTDDEKEEDAEALNWFPSTGASLKHTLICTPKNRPPEVLSVACSGEDGSLSLLTAKCPAIRVRSKLCRTESLMQSTPATIPG